jgi:PAS domain S-box-containing protein
MAPSRPASLRANSKLVRSLSGKFLLVFIPVFLLISVLGILLLARYDKREDRDSLATRIGSQAARVIASIERHGANDNPGLAQDFVAALASDHAVTCVEYRDGRLLAAVPPRIGCSTVANGYRLALPVGEDGAGSLLVIFSDAEIASAVEVRRNLVLLLIAIAFLVSTFSALTGFRLIVGRPLQRLHASIEREAQKERRIDQANREILALNRTLEARVAERTEQLHESERRLRELVDQFGSGIYIHAKFKPIYANKTLLDMFGYDGQEDFLAIGSTENLLAPEERPRVWGYHQARLRGEPAPTDYDLIALKKSGERFPVNNRSFVVKWNP